MSFQEQKLNYGHIVRINTLAEETEDGQMAYYIVGKRFDKRYIYLVQKDEIKNFANSDNSLWEIVHAEKNPYMTGQNFVDSIRRDVKFGDEVLFRHVNSGKYLSITQEFSDSKRGRFKLLLGDYQAANVSFQLLPTRTFQKLADPVKFNSNICIYNSRFHVYLDRERCDDRDVLVGDHVLQITWRMDFYSEDIESQDDSIMDKDLVFLINSKGSGLLSISKESNEPDSKFEFIVRNVPQSYPIKKEPKLFSCIWLVAFNEPESMNKQGSFGMTLTHLVQNYTQNNMVGKLVHASRDGSNFNGISSGEYIKLGILKEQERSAKRIYTGSNIRGVERSRVSPKNRYEEDIWLGEEQVRFNSSMMKRNKHHHQGHKVRPNYVKGLHGVSQTDCVVFQIMKLPFRLKKQLYEFLEARDKMLTFNDWVGCRVREDLRLQPDHERTRRFKQAEEIFKYVENALHCEEHEILQKQMMLFDIRFLGALLDCMKEMYKKQSVSEAEYLPELQKCRGEMASIFKELHKILRIMCRNNQLIKEDISKTSVKALLSLSTQGAAGQGSFDDDTETLKQIFSGNKFAVENVMRPHEVSDLIKEFKRSPVSAKRFIRFVQIMRLLCRSSRLFIPVNQRIIIKEFLQDQSFEHCRIKMRTNKKSQVLVSMDRDSWCSLLELADPKRSSESADQWQSFSEWIQLVSDVCQGHNSVGSFYAQTLFNYRVLQDFMKFNYEQLDIHDFSAPSQSDSLDKIKLHLHKFIIPLLKNIHVKNSQNQPIRFDLIYLVPTEDKINFTTLHHTPKKFNTDILGSIRNFIQNYLRLFCNFHLRRDDYIAEDKQNEKAKQAVQMQNIAEQNLFSTVKNVMILLKEMIQNGFWIDDQLPRAQRNSRQKDLIQKLIIILKIDQSKLTVPYQMAILQIFNFYLDQSRYENSDKNIKKLYDRFNNYNTAYLLSHEIETDIDFLDGQFITNLKSTIFQIMCSEAGKNNELFILCMNTNKKLIEIKRTLYINLKDTLVVVPNQDDMQTYQKLCRARYIFRVFNTKGLKTIDMTNQYELDVPIWDYKQQSIIGTILELIQFMKQPYEEVEKKRIYEMLGETEELHQPYTEHDRPNKKIQKMIKEMGIHKLMFNIIVDFTPNIDTDSQTLYWKLVESIYYFLTVFAWRNIENKQQLNQIWDYMRQHSEVNCGAISALKEYFSQNESLLHNQDKISIVSEKITDYISHRRNGTMYDQYYAAKLLDFFEALLTYNGTKLKQNCIRVLSYILDKSRLHITIPDFLTQRQHFLSMIDKHSADRNEVMSATITNKKQKCKPKEENEKASFGGFQQQNRFAFGLVDVKAYTSEQSFVVRRDSEKFLCFDGKLSYLIVLFRILSELVEQNPINIAKCKKLHSPQLLTFVLSKAGICWALKAPVRNYINKLYYSQMEKEYYDRISNTEVDIFIDDMNDYIKMRLTKQMEDFRIKNPIKWTYPLTTLYLSIRSIIDSLHIITEITQDKNKDNFMNQLSNEMRRGNIERDDIKIVYTTIRRFIRLYERLRFIKLYFFIEEPELRSKIQAILLRMEYKIFQFNFSKHSFINKNDKSFDYREISKKLVEDEKIVGAKDQKNELNEELSLCAKMLSNTELQNYFKNNEFYKDYACNPAIVLSFLDKNEKDPYLMIIDKKFKRKQSVINLVQLIMSRNADLKLEDLTFIKYYNNFLQDLFKEQETFDLETPTTGINYDRIGRILQTINSRISHQYRIFSSEHLTFYFRTLTSNLGMQDAKLINIFRQLNQSFAQLIFRTIVQCDLHQNIEVAHELFTFARSFYNLGMQIKAQQHLYNLVHNDAKNEFLTKLDNFILFLSDDIIRVCIADEQSEQARRQQEQYQMMKREKKENQERKVFIEQHDQNGNIVTEISEDNLPDTREIMTKPHRHQIFNEATQFFVDVEEDQTNIDHIIMNQHTLECFKSVFKLLQLLCQNNFVEFKKEFREQKMDTTKIIKLNNKNLLIRSTIELRKIFRVYCERIKSVPHKILDFLNEIAQIPCEINQIELSKSTFFQDVCQFLNQHRYEVIRNKPEMCIEVSKITEKFLKIVLSLLESNNQEIYTSFSDKMDRLFFKKLLEYHERMAEDKGRAKELEDADRRLKKLKLTMLIIEKQLSSNMKKDDLFLASLRDLIIQRNQNNQDEIFKTQKFIQSIEVTLDGNNHKLYFFKPSEAADINQVENECLQRISDSLSRDTQLQKLQSLMRQSRKLQLYIMYRGSVKESWFWQTMLKHPVNTYATIISLIINILLVITTTIAIDKNGAYSKYDPLLILLEIIQFFLGTLYCTSTIYSEIRKAELEKFNQKSPDEEKMELNFTRLDISKICQVIFIDNAAVVGYQLISILGLLVSPYYYCIHIFYLFGRVKTLTNVYMAVVMNLYQLLFLAFLSIGFFVVFSILTVETYAPFAGQEYCSSIYSCFLMIYNKEVFIQKSQANEPNFRTLSYEIIYGVFFGSLFGNIVSGLMTDTFAQLRDNEERIIQDQQNFCYICGQSRYEIEKDNRDKLKLNEIFPEHLKKHNKWSYLYYIYELKNKKSTQYTGLEYIIVEKVKKKSATWFPVKSYEQRDIQEYMNALRQVE